MEEVPCLTPFIAISARAYHAVRETKNILVAFIIHGLHNTLVILSMML